jgi:hypothetical protein
VATRFLFDGAAIALGLLPVYKAPSGPATLANAGWGIPTLDAPVGRRGPLANRTVATWEDWGKATVRL